MQESNTKGKKNLAFFCLVAKSENIPLEDKIMSIFVFETVARFYNSSHKDNINVVNEGHDIIGRMKSLHPNRNVVFPIQE